MNWEAIGAIAELLGAIGVIVSLLYLATQIRQNTSSVRAAAIDSAAEQFAAGLLATATHPDLAELMDTGSKDYGELTGADRRRFRALLTAQIRQFEAIFLKYRSGLLPESQWEGFGNAVEYSMRRPGSRQCWVEVRPVFSPEFRSFVDEAIVRVSES